jgi:hypothetical protein
MYTSTIHTYPPEDLPHHFHSNDPENRFSNDGRTLILNLPPYIVELPVPPTPFSLQQKMLLNILEHKRRIGWTSVYLPSNLMECLAILPSFARTFLVQQDKDTIAFKSTEPTLAISYTDVCSICHRSLTNTTSNAEDPSLPAQIGGEIVFTHCGHIFHENCLATALRYKLTCPICITAITPATKGQLISRHLMNARFSQVEEYIRAHPFVLLPTHSEMIGSDFERDFISMPHDLKEQLRTLQQDLQKELNTPFVLSSAPETSLATDQKEAETLPVQEESERKRSRLDDTHT